MIISATSALVLNWTDESLWQTNEAKVYGSKLDLSEGDSLLALYNKEERFMHLQAVTGRKYFMLKKATGFLKNLQEKSMDGQVIILAAGLAPVSVEVAALFPSSKVFDVDKYLMKEKKNLVNGYPPNISFIECDITLINRLHEKLLDAGFDPGKPTIAIIEGIIYYLDTDDLKRILEYLNKQHMMLAGDFCLKPGSVNEKTRSILTEAFRKIKEQVGLKFVNFYTEQEMTGLILETGFKSVGLTNMQDIQKERTGDDYPFVTADSCWVGIFYAEPQL